MSQLYRIYKSVVESIWSTISASFLSASIVAFLVFLIYVGIHLYCSWYQDRSLQTSDMVHIFCQGIWFSLFSFYMYMVLFRTWIARPYWEKPLEKFFGSWGLYTDKGEFTTEAIENGMLLFPFTWFLGILLRERWKRCSVVFALGCLSFCGFLMSLSIETVQVIWKRGTFQLSDLFYNTVGGILGGIFFLVIHKHLIK